MPTLTGTQDIQQHLADAVGTRWVFLTDCQDCFSRLQRMSSRLVRAGLIKRGDRCLGVGSFTNLPTRHSCVFMFLTLPWHLPFDALTLPFGPHERASVEASQAVVLAHSAEDEETLAFLAEALITRAFAAAPGVN